MLVGYVSIAVEPTEPRDEGRVKLLREVSNVLREFLLIKSRHSHFYMAKEAFMKIYFKKVRGGVCYYIIIIIILFLFLSLIAWTRPWC